MADNLSDRVSGGNPLERRCRLLLALSLLLIISLGFIWYGHDAEVLIERQDRVRARLLVDNVMLQTHWHVWVSEAKLKDFLEDHSASLQREKYSWQFLRADGADSLDPYDREVLQQFPKSSSDEGDNFVDRINYDKQRYDYYQPVYAKSQSCVACHRQAVNQPSLQLHDLIAVAKVQVSTEATQHERSKHRAMLIATSLITAVLAIVAAFLVIRLTIFKPLERQQGPQNEHR